MFEGEDIMGEEKTVYGRSKIAGRLDRAKLNKIKLEENDYFIIYSYLGTRTTESELYKLLTAGKVSKLRERVREYVYNKENHFPEVTEKELQEDMKKIYTGDCTRESTENRNETDVIPYHTLHLTTRIDIAKGEQIYLINFLEDNGILDIESDIYEFYIETGKVITDKNGKDLLITLTRPSSYMSTVDVCHLEYIRRVLKVNKVDRYEMEENECINYHNKFTKEDENKWRNNLRDLMEYEGVIRFIGDRELSEQEKARVGLLRDIDSVEERYTNLVAIYEDIYGTTPTDDNWKNIEYYVLGEGEVKNSKSNRYCGIYRDISITTTHIYENTGKQYRTPDILDSIL